MRLDMVDTTAVPRGDDSVLVRRRSLFFRGICTRAIEKLRGPQRPAKTAQRSESNSRARALRGALPVQKNKGKQTQATLADPRLRRSCGRFVPARSADPPAGARSRSQAPKRPTVLERPSSRSAATRSPTDTTSRSSAAARWARGPERPAIRHCSDIPRARAPRVLVRRPRRLPAYFSQPRSSSTLSVRRARLRPGATGYPGRRPRRSSSFPLLRWESHESLSRALRRRERRLALALVSPRGELPRLTSRRTTSTSRAGRRSEAPTFVRHRAARLPDRAAHSVADRTLSSRRVVSLSKGLAAYRARDEPAIRSLSGSRSEESRNAIWLAWRPSGWNGSKASLAQRRRRGARTGTLGVLVRRGTRPRTECREEPRFLSHAGASVRGGLSASLLSSLVERREEPRRQRSWPARDLAALLRRGERILLAQTLAFPHQPFARRSTCARPGRRASPPLAERAQLLVTLRGRVDRRQRSARGGLDFSRDAVPIARESSPALGSDITIGIDAPRRRRASSIRPPRHFTSSTARLAAASSHSTASMQKSFAAARGPRSRWRARAVREVEANDRSSSAMSILIAGS